MTTMCVLDTSVLLAEGRRALYAFDDATVVVPLVVVRELESKRSHPELGYTARSALKELRELSRKGDIKEGVNTGNSTIRVELNHVTHDGLGLILDKVSSLNDTKIVSVAKHLTDDGHDTTLYTKDIPLALLATLVDVKADDLPFVGNKEIHKPIQTYYVTDEDIDLLYSEGSARLDIDSPINTGVILQGANASAIAITRPEFKFEVVRDAGVFGVEGRSAPQTVALSQLTDESIKAVSLGGPAGTGKTMLALAAASLAPNVFSAVVAISPTPSFVRRRGWPYGLAPERLASFREQVCTESAASLRRFIVDFNRGDLRATDISRQLMRQMDDFPSTEALATGLDWLQEIDLRATLLGLGVPVLVFHGTADSLIPPIAGRWIADHVARGRFVAVEGAAHAPFWGRTDFMAGEIRRFLCQQKAKTGTESE